MARGVHSGRGAGASAGGNDATPAETGWPKREEGSGAAANASSPSKDATFKPNVFGKLAKEDAAPVVDFVT